jgi:hypothetical protein
MPLKKTNKFNGLKRSLSLLKKYFFKSTLIISVCTISIIAPLALPIFSIISFVTWNKSYMLCSFIIVELKDIITFIIDS